MSKFNRLISIAVNTLLEQSMDDPEVAELGAAAPVSPEVAGDPSAIPSDEEPEMGTLSPEAEVNYIKIIRRALLIDFPELEKARALNAIPDEDKISSENAKEVFELLLGIIESKSSDSVTRSSDMESLNIPL